VKEIFRLQDASELRAAERRYLPNGPAEQTDSLDRKGGVGGAGGLAKREELNGTQLREMHSAINR
jgi:hypothetical protein